MLRITPWVVLALSTFAHARFDLLQARNKASECCPCPSSGKPAHNVETVTVTGPVESPHVATVNAPYGTPSKETVTVEHTVTEPGHTIFVTQVEKHTVTEQVTVTPIPAKKPNGKHAKTMSITSGPPSPGGRTPKGNEGDDEESHKHVAITVGGNGYNHYEVNPAIAKNPSGPKAVKTVPAGDSKLDYGTKTIHEGDKYYPVVIKPEPSTKVAQDGGNEREVVVRPEPSTATIVLNNGKTITRVVEVPHTVTLTSPPQRVTQNTQQYQAITNEYHDIANKDGGKVYDDMKYDIGSEHYVTVTEEASAATLTECPLMPASTSVQTVYNTVVMTVGPNGSKPPKPTQTATTPAAAQSTEGRKLRVRRGRARFPAWW